MRVYVSIGITIGRHINVSKKLAFAGKTDQYCIDLNFIHDDEGVFYIF